jgi:hypothetical protein
MSDILKKQAELQVEADAIVGALHLDALLRTAGDPVRVGSSALGLMVRRDIDITVVCERLDPATRRTVAEIAGELMLDSHVGALRYRNDSGVWNVEPQTTRTASILASPTGRKRARTGISTSGSSTSRTASRTSDT